MIEDWFNDITAAITNSKEEIDIDLIGNSWKKAHTETLREISKEDNMKNDILGIYKIQIYKSY